MFFFFPMQLSAQSGLDLEFKPGGKYMERWQFWRTLGRVQIWPIFTTRLGVTYPPVIIKDSDKNGTNVEIDQTRDTTKCT